jgi:PAS domain S-box-containing protein
MDSIHQQLAASRALFVHSADALFVSDHEARVLDVNEKGCRLVGYTRDELLALRLVDMLPPAEVNRLANRRERILAGREELAEVELRRKDGSSVQVELNTTVLPDGRWQAVVRDISERKRTVHAYDEVLSVVAHDLRSPIATAQIAATMLAMRPKGAPELAARLQRSLDRATRLIDDLLDSSRIARGWCELETRPTSATDLIDALLDMLSPVALRASIVLDSKISPDLRPVSVDPRRIHQVLSNLVGNALAFTPAGGAVTIVVDAQDGCLRFAVRDTGPGIPPAHLPHVFDRFWRARTHGHRGAGLGLAIAKGIVEAHGGTIEVRSVVGEGSTFAFTLPVAPIH